MEQHPIPQDITGFKFKLVGDMTLKQFGELAGGAIMAYIFYSSSWLPFIKWPLVAFFGLLGVALAFLPIEERPLDTWIINFFKAIYRPTLFVWKKNATPTLAYTNPPTTTAITPQEEPTLAPWPYEKPKEEKPVSVDGLQKLRDIRLKELEEAKKQAEEVVAAKNIEAAKQEGGFEGKKIVTVEELAQMRAKKVSDTDQAQNKQVAEGEEQLNKLIEQNKAATSQEEKDRLAGEIAAKQESLSAARVEPLAKEIYKVVPKPKEQIRPTISLTDLPNVINGMVTDEKGMPLDSVIIVIKDKAGNSTRALKTNKAGQFMVSTPMENGVYYLEMERAGYKFDVLEITLTGTVLKPMEIVAKAG